MVGNTKGETSLTGPVVTTLLLNPSLNQIGMSKHAENAAGRSRFQAMQTFFSAVPVRRANPYIAAFRRSLSSPKCGDNLVTNDDRRNFIEV